ncbi:hypothetical protein EJ04DRAFT_510023, partial [Polyplosphaeria fusca]
MASSDGSLSAIPSRDVDSAAPQGPQPTRPFRPFSSTPALPDSPAAIHLHARYTLPRQQYAGPEPSALSLAAPAAPVGSRSAERVTTCSAPASSCASERL